ncbi:MAG: hypothetical protein AAGC93_19125 [Cyanobacteria bacterium P01_F01_bin.53]
MSASDPKSTESDETIRKLVIPVVETGTRSDDPDGDRSPTDEETKRDSPFKSSADDASGADETVRTRVEPDTQ